MYRFRQFYLLIWKNFLLQFRRPVGTIFEIILPVVFVAVLILARLLLKPKDKCFTTYLDSLNTERLHDYQQLLRVYSKTEKRNKNMNNAPIVNNASSVNNVSIAYYPSTPALKELMNRVSFLMNIPVTSSNAWKSEGEMAAQVSEGDARYYGAVAFLGKKVDYDGNALPVDIKYAIRLPAERWQNDRTYPRFQARGPRRNSLYSRRFIFLQYALNAGIHQVITNSSEPFQFILKQLPYPKYREDVFNVTVSFLLPILLTLAFIYTAMMIVKELVFEKQCRLKESMKMMGLSNWIHWSAWFFKCFFFSLISVILVTVILKVFKIFEYSDGTVVFVFFILYMTSGIVFCFAISVIFSNAVLSMLFSGAIWFITLVPFLFYTNDSKYEALSTEAKSGICLLVNSCLGIAAKSFSRYEERGVGVTWSNINSSPSADDDFSMAQVFLMFIVQIVMYGLFAWYYEAVFPGDYGIPHPPYFLFTKSYWCGINTAKVESSQDATAISNLHTKNPDYEEEPTNLEVGVSIRNLTKVFKGAKGKKVAVDHLSFNMFKGQITSLLGHNGAGKTTTMSILTGLFPPSSGCAYINGYNILTDIERIRDSLGLCPQHNVLFDKLTVKEHLKFFVNLKGKFGPEAESEINAMIEDIQLTDKANWQSRLLSGGMKRKLSCAIALIGGSEIVFLDEPTSGMDPYARRATWDLLMKYRTGKTIILTTHFMDEADFLGDRIAIMADGQLRCCGSSLFLKNRYGVGYRLTVVKGPNCNVNSTQSLVCNHVKDGKIVSDVGAELAFVLPSQSSGDFEPLFKELEERRNELGISSFGVSVTTLEEVFIKVGEGLEHTVDEIVEGQEAINDTHSVDLVVDPTSDPTSELDPSELLKGVALKFHQFKAMFMKRFLHSLRDKKAVLTQLLVPLFFTVVALILATIVSAVDDEPSRLLDFQNLSVDGEKTKVFFAKFTINSPVTVKRAQSYLGTMNSEVLNITDDVVKIRDENQGNQIVVNNKVYPANSSENCCKMERLIINKKCVDELGISEPPCIPVGYKDCANCLRGSRSDCPPMIADTHPEEWQSTYQEYVLRKSKPGDYFNIHVAGIMMSDYKNRTTYTSWYSNQGIHTIASSANVLSNILIKSVNDSYSITAYNHPLPYSIDGKTENVTTDASALLLAIFITFGMAFLVASFITFIILERESKAKHIQFISGVDTISFWSATYLWDFLNYMVPATVVIIIFAVFQVDAYQGENLAAVYLLLILQGLAAIPFVYCLSYIFKSPLVGYAITVLLLAFVSLALLITVFVLDLIGDKDEANIVHYVSLLLPTYAFSSSFLEMNKNYGLKKTCTASPQAEFNCKMTNVKYVDNVLGWEDHGIGKQCLYLFLEAIVFFILCLLIQVRFFLSAPTHDALHGSSNDGYQEDGDVLTERRRVDNMTLENMSEEAVILKNLTKVYPGTVRTAVDNLSLGIPKGNCFGLLGINEMKPGGWTPAFCAGKTTTFGMLTGEFPISAGTAYLGGYNIQTDLRQVQQRIGYCPQFDALVEKLTGREMLTMYAHLRGVPGNKMKNLVNYTIESLDLVKWADKMCGTYSGGNRRKLSTAIALVGNPPIVFLDEPTTGMDPGARRFLWNYLTSVIQGGRSIVLTSHSMEECEALCTQLAIMVNGKFKCLGGIQHLKSRFGSGYTLMLKVSPPDMQVVSSGPPSPIASVNNSAGYFDQPAIVYNNPNMEQGGIHLSPLDGCVEQAKVFVTKMFPGASLLDSRQGMLTYRIVSENLNWSYVFGVLEKSKEQIGIVDYSVSQTTLEQVFLNFAKDQFTEERTKLAKRTCCCC